MYRKDGKLFGIPLKSRYTSRNTDGKAAPDAENENGELSETGQLLFEFLLPDQRKKLIM